MAYPLPGRDLTALQLPADIQRLLGTAHEALRAAHWVIRFGTQAGCEHHALRHVERLDRELGPALAERFEPLREEMEAAHVLLGADLAARLGKDFGRLVVNCTASAHGVGLYVVGRVREACFGWDRELPAPARAEVVRVNHIAKSIGVQPAHLRRRLSESERVRLIQPRLSEEAATMPACGLHEMFRDLYLDIEGEARVAADRRRRARVTPSGRAGDDSKCKHSEDFTFVHWYGRDYEFTKKQAACVGALWGEWERGGFGLSEDTIAAKVDANDSGFRLMHTFRDNKATKNQPARRQDEKAVRRTVMHPAWGAMIHAAGKGKFKLAPPNSTENPTSRTS